MDEKGASLIASAIRQGFGDMNLRLDDILRIFDPSGGPGRGVMKEVGERQGGRLPNHHIGQHGVDAFMAIYNEGRPSPVEGTFFEGTLAGLEYYTKPNSEDPTKTSHKVQFLFNTDSGLWPLEAGASSAFVCGMIRQMQYLLDTGVDLRREQILIELKPGEKKAVLADISTSKGETILPAGSGGKWALYHQDTRPPEPLPDDQQPWLAEIKVFIASIREAGLIAIDPSTKEGQKEADSLALMVLNASTIDAVKQGLHTIDHSPLYEGSDVAFQRQILIEKKSILHQYGGELDNAALMACTDEEMQALRWPAAEGAAVLQQRYQKRSRHQLSDEELMDFVAYLRAFRVGKPA